MTVLTMLTVCALKEANSSMNVTHTPSASNWVSFFMIALLKKTASWTVVEVKISLRIIRLCAVAWFRTHAILTRSSSNLLQVFDAFFLFKMRQELIGQKEVG